MEFNQQDFEKYIQERRLNDKRYSNIPLNSEIENYDNSSNDDSDTEKMKTNKILDQNRKPNSDPSTIVKKNTVIINSLDRDIDDTSQNKYKFKVKFSPSTDSYTKKYPIYENSEFFLQTEYQKKMGIQGFERNVEHVKLKEQLKIDGYHTAYRQCSVQPGNMIYEPSKPRGKLIGYNFLYESSDSSNGATIQTNFNSIESIKLKKIIIPYRNRSYPYDITLYGNIFDNIPYIYVKIPELTYNYHSTSPELREAFCILVQESKQNNINSNPFSYTTFVPINDDYHVYIPPKDSLNMITIELIIPPLFHYIPNSISNLYTSSVMTNSADDSFLNINYQVGVLSEIKIVKQLIIFEYKQQTNISSWDKRAKLFGVNQPSSFLQEKSIYDFPQNSTTKNNITCFAIITNDYFSKETFIPASIVKLTNYVAKLNKIFANFNSNILKDSENPMSIEYYIPNIFISGTKESKIWSDDTIRKEAKELLIISISRILNNIENYLNSHTGIPIIEIGHIDNSCQNIESENIKNCYEYINNYINIKYLGRKIEEIPFCNIKDTNKYSKPFKCDCITSLGEYMSGFCQQTTAEDFGDFSNIFSRNNYGFYKDIKKDSIPDKIQDFYDDENFTNYKGNISLAQNNGTIDYYYYNDTTSGLKDMDDKNIFLTLKKEIDNNKTEKNIKYNEKDLFQYYEKIFLNLEKIKNNVQTGNKYDNKIISVSTYYKLFKLATNLFFDEINKEEKNIKLIISELEDTLINFHFNLIKPFFDIEYESIVKELSINSLENPNKLIKKFNITDNFSEIFFLWFEIIYNLDIFFDIVNIIKDSNQPVKIRRIFNLFLNKINIENILNDDSILSERSLNMFDKEINKNILFKPCSRYNKGGNQDGLCNVIILPFPKVLNLIDGSYEDIGQFLDTENEIFYTQNLGYDNKNIKKFNSTIMNIAFTICKQILYNGGPASFPSEKITAGGERKKCKIISISEQNTFIFEVNELKANINKII